MNKTSIGWTDFTSNPIRYKDAAGQMVWGCERISPGCAHCYAAELAQRYGRGAGAFTAEEMATYTPYFDEDEERHILRARTCGSRPVKGGKCFIGDMTDIFGSWVPDKLLDRLFAVMALRHDVTFQILTKRPERMRAYLSGDDCEERIDGVLYDMRRDPIERWPLPNVWLGTSVENQHWANIRIIELLQTPAAKRFISGEPLLALTNIRKLRIGDRLELDALTGCYSTWYEGGGIGDTDALLNALRSLPPRLPGLDWVIGGMESGDDRRDPGVEPIIALAKQCIEAGVPFFCKQDVASRPGQQWRIPDDIWALKQFPEAA